MTLYNKYGKEDLRKRLSLETFKRITLSFYRYVIIDEVAEYRNYLYSKLSEIGVLGRIYIAHEGINAQVNVPEHNMDAFRNFLNSDKLLKNMPLKIAVDHGESFLKLIVRVRKKIVADGLSEAYDVTNTGNHLSAEGFNEAMKHDKTLVIDMRNHYESEVGRFENAICPDADTFRDALPQALEMVKGKEDHKLLLYCTGGIRCEKASAWFRHHGFKDVNQLYGGIIAYAAEVKEKNLENKFIGKNFVFDNRLGERITNDVISKCHLCGALCDQHVNCANDDCHLLFIQCNACFEKLKGCCSVQCMEIAALPIEEQRRIRKGKKKTHAHAVHKSRLRPRPGVIT